MELQRRGFLKVVTSGLALGCANHAIAFEQSSAQGVSGELETSSGTLHLRGRLKSGVLTLDAQGFLDRSDHSVIVRGKLGSTELYSAMFSYQADFTVFALFHDNGHSTTAVLSESETPGTGRLVVWNDNNTPQIHNLDKRKIFETDNPREIKDLKDKTPDLVGNRKPPAFTWQELESVFGKDPALLQFMHGRKSTHEARDEDEMWEWICRFLSMVPGSMLSLFWVAGYPPSSSSHS